MIILRPSLFGISRSTSVGDSFDGWILLTGFWNDAGVWLDNAVWVD